MLKQDVMILKHATATFWRTPASELLVIAAGGSGLKCLMDGRGKAACLRAPDIHAAGALGIAAWDTT